MTILSWHNAHYLLFKHNYAHSSQYFSWPQGTKANLISLSIQMIQHSSIAGGGGGGGGGGEGGYYGYGY